MKRDTKLGMILFVQMMIGLGLSLQVVLSLFTARYQTAVIYAILSGINILIFWAWARKQKKKEKKK
jgi:membrane protein implicated in regulation of membrane protease activity